MRGFRAINTYGPTLVRQHTTARSPILLAQFDGNMLDSSGNGYNLTAVGTCYYPPIFPGSSIRSLYLDGTTAARRTTRTAALDITGAISVEFLAYTQKWTSSQVYWFAYTGATEAEADNYLWSMYQNGSMSYGAFTEHGAGINDDAPGTVPGFVCQLVHLCLTRASDGVTWKMYQNGLLLDTFTAANAPTTAAPAQGLEVGRDISGLNVQHAMIASFCVIGAELTAAQVLEDAVHCLPWLE